MVTISLPILANHSSYPPRFACFPSGEESSRVFSYIIVLSVHVLACLPACYYFSPLLSHIYELPPTLLCPVPSFVRVAYVHSCVFPRRISLPSPLSMIERGGHGTSPPFSSFPLSLFLLLLTSILGYMLLVGVLTMCVFSVFLCAYGVSVFSKIRSSSSSAATPVASFFLRLAVCRYMSVCIRWCVRHSSYVVLYLFFPLCGWGFLPSLIGH